VDTATGHTLRRGVFLILIPLVRDPTPSQIQKIDTTPDPVRPADAEARRLAVFPRQIPGDGTIELSAHAFGINARNRALMSLAPNRGYFPDLVIRTTPPDYALIAGERLLADKTSLIDMRLTAKCRYIEEVIGRDGHVRTRHTISRRTAERLMVRTVPDVLPRWHQSRQTQFHALINTPPDELVIPYQPHAGGVKL
jgi:hypothetical protein